MRLQTVSTLLGARFGGRHAPLSIGFEITHRCNLSCSYCDRHTPRADEMPRSTIMTALDELCSTGMQSLSLDGGEPLTHPHIDEVVAWLAGRGVRVLMNSNGLLVERKIGTVRKLSKLKISLDGPQRLHDAARGRGAFT
ncbi:MAG: radical SAM protein, partial [Myxococcota bacterium]